MDSIESNRNVSFGFEVCDKRKMSSIQQGKRYDTTVKNLVNLIEEFGNSKSQLLCACVRIPILVEENNNQSIEVNEAN